MNPDKPPPLPKASGASIRRRSRVLVGLALLPPFCVGALLVLRACGLLRPFTVPTVGMAPAVSAHDHVVTEGVTYLFRQPRRGDVIVFRSSGIGSLPPAQMYVKRIAGEPNDHVQISDGKLFVNDKQVLLSNVAGQIAYELPPHAATLSPQTNVTVPSGCYFLLGDNSTNSSDSRFWGSVPRGNIIGRVSFCYWPPERVGGVK